MPMTAMFHLFPTVDTVEFTAVRIPNPYWGENDVCSTHWFFGALFMPSPAPLPNLRTLRVKIPWEERTMVSATLAIRERKGAPPITKVHVALFECPVRHAVRIAERDELIESLGQHVEGPVTYEERETPVPSGHWYS